MNYEKMSEKLQQILMRAVEICKSYGHASVDTIQLLKAIFEDEVLDGLFKRLNVDKREALALIDDEMNRMREGIQYESGADTGSRAQL